MTEGLWYEPVDDPADVLFPELEPQGVTTWRKKPAVVRMVRWDGSEAARKLIDDRSGRPSSHPGIGLSLSVWVEASRAWMVLNPGDWAALEPDGSGVYPVRASEHEAGYEPADAPVPACDVEIRRLRAEAARLREKVADLEGQLAMKGGGSA